MSSNNLCNHHGQVLMYFLSKYSYIEWLSCFLFLARCFQRRMFWKEIEAQQMAFIWWTSSRVRNTFSRLKKVGSRQARRHVPPMPLLIKVAAAASSLALSDVSSVWRSTIGATYFSYLVVYRECGERGANSVLLALGEPTVKWVHFSPQSKMFLVEVRHSRH